MFNGIICTVPVPVQFIHGARARTTTRDGQLAIPSGCAGSGVRTPQHFVGQVDQPVISVNTFLLTPNFNSGHNAHACSSEMFDVFNKKSFISRFPFIIVIIVVVGLKVQVNVSFFTRE